MLDQTGEAQDQVPPAPTGWRRRGAVRFDRGDVGLGEVAGEVGHGRGVYGDRLAMYGRDWTDNSGLSLYDWPNSVTVEDGRLRIHCHTRADGQRVAAAMVVLHPEHGDAIPPGTAVECAMRVLGTSRFGHAMLLWPTSEVWAEGELNFPEGGHDDRPRAYHHEIGEHPERNHAMWPNGAAGAAPQISWHDWHHYRIEWRSDSVRYLVDRSVVLSVDDPTQIPITPHKLVLQSGVHQAESPPTAHETSVIETAWWVFDQAVSP